MRDPGDLDPAETGVAGGPGTHPGPGGELAAPSGGPYGSGEIGGLMPGVDDRPAVSAEAHDPIVLALRRAVEEARTVQGGALATFTPALSCARPEATSAAVVSPDGVVHRAGDWETHRFTLQSASKLILLVGLLEELGEEAVFELVGTEASGDRYDSLLQMTLHWPRPANPLINAGAIALAGLLPGDRGQQRAWIDGWAARLFGAPLDMEEEGLEHEMRSNDINRAIAHLLKTSDCFRGEIESALRGYYSLCSLETDVVGAATFAAVLARGGTTAEGTRVLSARTVEIAVSLMAVCGMYNDSGSHLMSVGMAAKSGVSGVILAVAPGRAGIAASSPLLGPLGTSIRGQLILRRLSEALRWHFAHSDS